MYMLRFNLTSRKEGNVLFNDTLNTFYLRLYGVGLSSRDQLFKQWLALPEVDKIETNKVKKV